MIKVGITGGIGSGKSTICNIFKTLGVPVYNSDLESRNLTNTHPSIVKGVKELFGDDVYTNGQLDRKRVGAIVFNDKNKLTALNQVIHPIVADHFNNWLSQNNHHKYILKEAAILFESGAYKQVDQIITVVAPIDLRIKRVMKRDGLSYEEVESRIGNQLKDEEKIQKSDYVIYCNDINLVIPQVVSIHKALVSF